MSKRPKRYCGMCDKWVPARETICKACGATTDKAETSGIGERMTNQPPKDPPMPETPQPPLTTKELLDRAEFYEEASRDEWVAEMPDYAVRDVAVDAASDCHEAAKRIAQLEAERDTAKARLAVYVRCNRRILKKHGWDVPDGADERPDISPKLHHPDLPGCMADDRAAFGMHLIALKHRVAQLEAQLAQVRAQQGKLFEALKIAAHVMEVFDVGVDSEIREALATGTPPAPGAKD